MRGSSTKRHQHTNPELLDRLKEHGFVELNSGPDTLLMRGPNGGRVTIPRRGWANPASVRRATDLLRISEDAFWGLSAPRLEPVPEHPEPKPTKATRPATKPSCDSVVSAVMSVHSATGRPLSFDDVVRLSERPLRRDQVSQASNTLCRDGCLRRVRAGIYQWVGRREGSGSNTVDINLAVNRTDETSTSVPVPPESGSDEAVTANEILELVAPGWASRLQTADEVKRLGEWWSLTEWLLSLDSQPERSVS